MSGDVQSSFPCGVCGASDVHQYTLDPAAQNSCVAWLQSKSGELVSKSKKEGNQHAQVRCVQHGPQSFSLKVRAHMNQSSPSTNTLVVCPFCPERPIPVVHWSYPGPDPDKPMGMAAHLKKRHPMREVPPDLKSKITISLEERELVLRAGKEPPKQRKRAARPKPAPESTTPVSIPATPNPAYADVPPSNEIPTIPPPPPQEGGGKRNESDFKTATSQLAMACRDGPQMVMAKRITDSGISKWHITGPVGDWLHPHNRNAMQDDKIDVGDECYSIVQ